MRAILEEEGLFDYALGGVANPASTDTEALAAHVKAKRKCRNKLILSIDE